MFETMITNVLHGATRIYLGGNATITEAMTRFLDGQNEYFDADNAREAYGLYYRTIQDSMDDQLSEAGTLRKMFMLTPLGFAIWVAQGMGAAIDVASEGELRDALQRIWEFPEVKTYTIPEIKFDPALLDVPNFESIFSEALQKELLKINPDTSN